VWTQLDTTPTITIKKKFRDLKTGSYIEVYIPYMHIRYFYQIIFPITNCDSKALSPKKIVFQYPQECSRSQINKQKNK
jgi:hypothetical protein